MYYKITPVQAKRGGTYCLVDIAANAGTFRAVGCTKTYRVYPAGVRADNEARRIAYRDAAKRGLDARTVTFI